MEKVNATEVATTKVCKVCGEEKPITEFRTIKGGNKVNTCYTCSTAKRRETKMGGGYREPRAALLRCGLRRQATSRSHTAYEPCEEVA